MAKKLKLTPKELSALVAEARLNTILNVKDYNLSSDVKEPVSIAEREATGRAVEENRARFEQAETQKLLSHLNELSSELKRLNKENQKLSKKVQNLEKSERKQIRDMEYMDGRVTDLKQDVRAVYGKIKKIKDQTRETKKILQVFAAITGLAKPTDNLKIIRKKFTDELFRYNTKLKLDKKTSYNEKCLDFFG